MDQTGQSCTHGVIEIGIGEAALALQPRNYPLKEDAALLDRYAVSRVPDRPKLRIGESDHATMVLRTRSMSTAIRCSNKEGRSRLGDKVIVIL